MNDSGNLYDTKTRVTGSYPSLPILSEAEVDAPISKTPKKSRISKLEEKIKTSSFKTGNTQSIGFIISALLTLVLVMAIVWFHSEVSALKEEIKSLQTTIEETKTTIKEVSSEVQRISEWNS